MQSLRSVKEANYKKPHIVWFHLHEMSRTGKSVWDRKYMGGNLWAERLEGGGEWQPVDTSFLSEAMKMS